MRQYTFNIVLFVLCALLILGAHFELIGLYYQSVLLLLCINVILSASLNLVNGYMGEFSCGHGGFMCVGAYVSSVLAVVMFTKDAVLGGPWVSPYLAPFLFPAVLFVGAGAAALAGLLVAVPSFKTRGDYLAIITIAANYIVLSAVENTDLVGGSRGLQGMKRVVTAMNNVVEMPWMVTWILLGTIFTVWLLRRFVSSTYGKGVSAISQDEVAAEIMSVNTNKMKIAAFMISSGLAGLAGGLYAHQIGYVNPQSFSIMRSTECLVMVYLGGMGSLSGAVLSAVLFTLLSEALRFVLQWLGWNQVIKWVIIPLVLILLMQFRPEGIMGNKELTDIFPRLRKWCKFK